MSEMKEAARNAATPAPMRLVKMADFTDLFNKYRGQIAQIAPKKGLQTDRIIGLCAQVFAAAKPAYEGAKTIRDCTPQSIIAAVMQCSMLGLSPIPQRGECYFVPYGNEVQMQIGYQGWVLLAYKAGAVESVFTSCVYEGDDFNPSLGTDVDLPHKPGPNYGDPDKVTATYAVISLKGGGKVVKYLTRPMIERLRLKSPMQKKGVNGAWKTDYDKMAEAKAIKQAIKFVPREDEWRSADFIDESIAKLDQIESDSVEYSYPKEPEIIDAEAEISDAQPEQQQDTPTETDGQRIARQEREEKAKRRENAGLFNEKGGHE